MENKLRIILGTAIAFVAAVVIYELWVISSTAPAPQNINSAYVGYHLNTGVFVFPVAILGLTFFVCLFIPIFIYRFLKTKKFSQSALKAKDEATIFTLFLSAAPLLLTALGAILFVGITTFLFLKDFFR